ncbi:discoidin domain-containing protein [Paenibacillus sonchi]|nr:discoidin domain-containing protein [Paenibacillus sonchi]
MSAIPIMTSNNSPSGIVSASEAFSGTPAWKAFDGIKYYSTTNSNYSAWGTTKTSGWLRYEFPNEKIISKYVLSYGTHAANGYVNGVNPKNWTFEGSNDGSNWTILDSQSNVTNWTDGEEKTFTFNNDVAYKMYQINISSNNGYTGGTVNLTIHELAMFEKASTTPTVAPTPSPTVTPSPTPENPTGDRAILVVTMNTGLEKEFDLSMDEVNAFIAWYENKQSGTGKASYAIDKHDNNKGPFTNRKDYVIFDKILTFSVDEYSAK